jgi:hypothetical protein
MLQCACSVFQNHGKEDVDLGAVIMAHRSKFERAQSGLSKYRTFTLVCWLGVRYTHYEKLRSTTTPGSHTAARQLQLLQLDSQNAASDLRKTWTACGARSPRGPAEQHFKRTNGNGVQCTGRVKYIFRYENFYQGKQACIRPHSHASFDIF